MGNNNSHDDAHLDHNKKSSNPSAPTSDHTMDDDVPHSSLSERVRSLVETPTPSVTTPSPAPGPIMSPSPQAPAQNLQPTKIETVPTSFRWIHGGHEVYVTGSFNNWQGKILMYPNDDEFTLLIDIPPGTHTYKYIVDQEWRLDEDAPTVQIQNVWNNVIEVKRPVFEYAPASYADSDDEDADERKQKVSYGQRAPLSTDYVNDPPRLPPHLGEILLNNSNPVDPLMLPLPTHVVLNHLYISPQQDAAVVVTGMTQRFKPNSHTKITHKFVTTVYYAPRERKNAINFMHTTTTNNNNNANNSTIAGPAGMGTIKMDDSK